MNPIFIVSLGMAFLSLVSIFVSILFITDYSYWVLLGSWVMLAGSTAR
jgi:hypothetical protein